MQVKSQIISMVFSLLMLLFNVLVLNAVPLKWWSILFLAFGAGFGFAWGRTTQLDLVEGKVTGKRSIAFIFFWFASLAITQLLAAFAKSNIVAFGMAGMFFSTGATLSTNSNIIYRMKQMLSHPAVAESEAHSELQFNFCPNCGAKIGKAYRYCGICGEKI